MREDCDDITQCLPGSCSKCYLRGVCMKETDVIASIKTSSKSVPKVIRWWKEVKNRKE